MTAGLCGLVFVPFFVLIAFTYNPRRVVDGANDNLSGCYMGITVLREMERLGVVLENTEMGVILRKLMPKTYILVPGYGAQGASGKDLKGYFNEDGLGAIVNSSRGIIAAYKQEKYSKCGGENYADASRLAVEDMLLDIRTAVGLA